MFTTNGISHRQKHSKYTKTGKLEETVMFHTSLIWATKFDASYCGTDLCAVSDIKQIPRVGVASIFTSKHELEEEMMFHTSLI